MTKRKTQWPGLQQHMQSAADGELRTLMMGARTSWASFSYIAELLVYCSMYMRMVAPAEPVPDRRKMMRDPSAAIAESNIRQ